MNVNQEHVLTFIRRPKWARHLLQHERRNHIVNTSGAYYYMCRQTGKYRVLSGLCPRIRRAFWAHSAYYDMMKQARRQFKRKKQHNNGRFGGLIRGSRVHKELNDFVLLGRDAFKKLHRGNLHHCTLQLLKAIVAKLELQPFLPEYDIYCEHIGVGTSVDMVCVDNDGRIVLLEFKTGYADSFLAQDGHMARSLCLMPCTPQNQATVQLVVAALILHKRYDVPLEEMRLYVMRCDDAVVEIIPVPLPFVHKLGPTIYDDLLAIQNET